MGVKKFKPTSPGRRAMSSSDFSEVTASSPLKKLTRSLGRCWAGRNASGRITVRRRGGGHKRRYRVVDFRRQIFGVPARVATIEYDPNRSARLALLHYADGTRNYVLAPKGLHVGDRIVSSRDADIRPGNSLPLGNIPVGTIIHAIELKIGGGAKMCRAAGSSSGSSWPRKATGRRLRLPSGEVRKVHLELPGDHRSGRQRRAHQHQDRQGRPLRWLGDLPTSVVSR
jgi:large subunit ribosomal protein L2